MAKQNLTRSFRVVGLRERFQESLLLMKASFGCSFYENRNVAKNRPAVEPSGDRCDWRAQSFDIELYDFSKNLFEEGLPRNADAISERLATLNSE
jgi:hypothetical protein